jgi:predicted nucleic acid-binding protein
MKCCLLDSSFLIDLLNETADRQAGPATRWLQRNPAAQVWISPVTWAEVMEGALNKDAVRARLARYRWQIIGHAQADRVALRQSHAAQRLGENDAWQVAVAECMDADLVGHDRAFVVLGSRYDDHRQSVRSSPE